MLNVLAVSGYRSLRNLIVPLKKLNLITGANGTGKSSLYRAMRLLAETAQGSVIQSLAHEGGLPSTLWAGPEVIAASVKRGDHPLQGTVRKGPVRLCLGFASDTFGYLIDLGLPQPDSFSMFSLDPEIKREIIWHGPHLRPSTTLVDRRGPVVRVRRENQEWDVVEANLANFDSVMARLADPRSTPEVLSLRDTIRGWRFYDHFRVDAEAPARSPQIGTRTPLLSNDGKDLAAAIQTIQEIGDELALSSAVGDAFPSSKISVENLNGRFLLQMEQRGLLRPLDAGELSDGTLRYLLWIAVLLTPRPPQLMVLNEPETSLHPDLLPALARLIAKAAAISQIVVVSHAPELIGELSRQPGCNWIKLEKDFGETTFFINEKRENPPWQWPAR